MRIELTMTTDGLRLRIRTHGSPSSYRRAGFAISCSRFALGGIVLGVDCDGNRMAEKEDDAQNSDGYTEGVVASID